MLITKHQQREEDKKRRAIEFERERRKRVRQCTDRMIHYPSG